MVEREKNLLVHEEVVDRDGLRMYRSAARGTGVKIRKIGGAGTHYNNGQGIQLTVPNDEFLISVSGTETQNNKFGRNADKLRSKQSRKSRRSIF